MREPIASWNPARDVWETTQLTTCGHLVVYSATWPTSGTTRNGEAYALPTSARRISDGASFYLPTPNPFHSTNSETPSEWQARRADVKRRTGTMHGPALQVIVQSVLEGMPLLPGEYTPAETLFPTPDARAGGVGVDPGRGGRPNSGGDDLQSTVHTYGLADKVKSEYLPTPTTQDAANLGGPSQARRRSPGLNWIAPAVVAQRDELDPPGEQLMIPMADDAQPDWGPFAEPVARWAQVMARPAPWPLEDGPNKPRLSPRFVEWLMGYPAGWVTDVPGVSYRQQLKALGNSVVWQQAAAALDLMDLGTATERICEECGDDVAAYGYRLCSDCMDANPHDPRLGGPTP